MKIIKLNKEQIKTIKPLADEEDVCEFGFYVCMKKYRETKDRLWKEINKINQKAFRVDKKTWELYLEDD